MRRFTSSGCYLTAAFTKRLTEWWGVLVRGWPPASLFLPSQLRTHLVIARIPRQHRSPVNLGISHPRQRPMRLHHPRSELERLLEQPQPEMRPRVPRIEFQHAPELRRL